MQTKFFKSPLSSIQKNQKEETMNIVEDRNGELTVSHRVIADFTGIQQKNIVELLNKHKEDFEEFGTLSVSNGGVVVNDGKGEQPKTYHLNEQQATLLMTYLQNTPVVRNLKKALVREFYALRNGETAEAKIVQKPRQTSLDFDEPKLALPNKLTADFMKAVAAIYGRTKAQEIFAPYLGIPTAQNNTQSLTAPTSDEMEEFIDMRIVKKPGTFLTVEDLYKEYRTYFLQNGYQVKCKTNFGKEFKAAIGMESQVAKLNGVVTRGYINLAIERVTLEGQLA